MIRANGRQVKVVPSAGVGNYSVKVKRGDGSGVYEDVGEVTKWERRYNLRRVIVSCGWRARGTGRAAPVVPWCGSATTRTAARRIRALRRCGRYCGTAATP